MAMRIYLPMRINADNRIPSAICSKYYISKWSIQICKDNYKKKNQSSVIKKTTTLLIMFGHALKYFVSQEKLNFVSSLRKGAGAMVYIDIMQVVVKKMDSRRNFPRSDFH